MRARKGWGGETDSERQTRRERQIDIHNILGGSGRGKFTRVKNMNRENGRRERGREREARKFHEQSNLRESET